MEEIDELLVHNFEMKEETFRCGGCTFTTPSITELHHHQQLHGIGGSYYFCHWTQTAYPRFELMSSECQTDGENLCIGTTDNSDMTTDMFTRKHDDISQHESHTQEKLGLLKKREAPVKLKMKTVFEKEVIQRTNSPRISRTKSLNNERSHIQLACNFHMESPDDGDKCTDQGTESEASNESCNEVIIEQNNSVDIVLTNNGQNVTYTNHQEQTEGLDSIIQIHLASVDENNYQEQPHLPDHQYLKTSNSHKCIYCKNVSYKRKPSLIKHFKKFHNNELPFQCGVCDKRLVSMSEAEKHTQTHNRVQLKCPICEKNCPSEVSLTEHIATHNGTKPFACHLCPNTYARSLGLKEHLLIHSGEKSHTCEHCGKGFSSRTQILKHINDCVKKVECEVCKSRWPSRSKLKQHMRKHTGEKPYICEFCGQGFSLKLGLKRHKKFIHLKIRDQHCSQCEQTFVTKTALLRHERTHSQIRQHVCQECGKAFKELYTLRVHERRHTGEARYACEHCGERFRYNTGRKKHEKTCSVTPTA